MTIKPLVIAVAASLLSATVGKSAEIAALKDDGSQITVIESASNTIVRSRKYDKNIGLAYICFSPDRQLIFALATDRRLYAINPKSLNIVDVRSKQLILPDEDTREFGEIACARDDKLYVFTNRTTRIELSFYGGQQFEKAYPGGKEDLPPFITSFTFARFSDGEQIPYAASGVFDLLRLDRRRSRWKVMGKVDLDWLYGDIAIDNSSDVPVAYTIWNGKIAKLNLNTGKVTAPRKIKGFNQTVGSFDFLQKPRKKDEK